MHLHLHGLDSHVQHVTTQRLNDALVAEQRRLARGERQGRLGMAVKSLRVAIGVMLITAGERLRREPAQVTATSSIKRHATRTA